jgi:acyl-CoA synthetase (NDP forming)
VVCLDWRSALLKPDSVVLVGVSDDPRKTSGRPMHFLKRAGYRGKIFVVNPVRDTVQGQKAYASIGELPEVPQQAFLLTGADKVLRNVEECEELGIPVVTILSAGFSEAGEKGAENQRRLEEIVARGKVRVLGPSSIGVVNVHHGLTLTANAAFAEADVPRGGVFVGSHSGSLIGALVSRGKRKGIGFAGLVSVGGEVDLSIGEICSATLDDPEVTSYLLFLETMRHADELRRFALAAAERGKPVAAYKLGRSAEAAELALSHTGSLAGADEVADVFLRECGIARVDSFEGLLEVMPLLRHVRATATVRKGRVGIVTTTGGGAAMAVDQLAQHGVEIVPASDETRGRLAAVGIDAGHGRIIDLTLAGTVYDVMKSALDILRSAPEFDLVLSTVGSSARFNPELAVQPAIDSSKNEGTPLAVFLVPDAPEAARLLAEANVPAFQNPETCADAIAAALHRREPLPCSSPVAATSGSAPFHMLDEAQAYELLAAQGLASAPFVVLDPGQPVSELPFGYPVVAKVLDNRIAHKSDVGGVVVGLEDAEQLAGAMKGIAAAVKRNLPEVDVAKVLVQKMQAGVGEVLVGFRRDPQVGPVVVLAAGGVFTELYRDTAMRLAPTTFDAAREMICELKASRMLDGYRGRAKGDLDTLAKAIVAVSNLASMTEPFVHEAEINPLIVLREGEGVVAVDGLIRISDR